MIKTFTIIYSSIYNDMTIMFQNVKSFNETQAEIKCIAQLAHPEQWVLFEVSVND